MSSDFHIQFTRYGNSTREHSAGWFVAADDFSDAYRRANDLLRGMRAADPGHAYELADISSTGLDRSNLTEPRSWRPNILDRDKAAVIRDGSAVVGSIGKRKRAKA